MLNKLTHIYKLFDIVPKHDKKEIINEDKYLEKYKERLKTVLTDSWIDAIDEKCDESQREKNKQFHFKYDFSLKKTVIYKNDDFLVNLLETKNELIQFIYSKMDSYYIDKTTKLIFGSFIELIERIFYEDMLDYSKMNAYRIYDNLTILRELFRDLSIFFYRKIMKIIEVKNLSKYNWEDALIIELDECEDTIEGYTYEIFHNLENILEYIYIYYETGVKENIYKEKNFFIYFLIEVHQVWIPLIENIDKKLYSKLF